MRLTRYLSAFLVTAIAVGACAAGDAEDVQDAGDTTDGPEGGDAEIVFVDDLKERGRTQLRRLLSEHDLEPWIFTRVVRIEPYTVPTSHPVLTLSTRYLDDDAGQLATFAHEQIHWFAEERETDTDRAMEDLRALYPAPPDHEEVGTRSEESTYLHLVVCWLELDAMAQLIGEERARQLMSEKSYYGWVYERVLDDTDRIGAVLAKHGLLITPEQGLVVSIDDAETT